MSETFVTCFPKSLCFWSVRQFWRIFANKKRKVFKKNRIAILSNGYSSSFNGCRNCSFCCINLIWQFFHCMCDQISCKKYCYMYSIFHVQYSLADINLDHCVELTFFDGKLGGFLVKWVYKSRWEIILILVRIKSTFTFKCKKFKNSMLRSLI